MGKMERVLDDRFEKMYRILVDRCRKDIYGIG